MIKLALKTHTLNYCIDIIFDKVINQLSVPCSAKLHVSEVDQFLLISIIPNNKNTGYYICGTFSAIHHYIFNKQTISNPNIHKETRDSIEARHHRLNDHYLIERNIEYKHSNTNFIDVIYEHDWDIYDAFRKRTNK